MVWGDYFNSDTRTLLSILSISGVPFELKEIDTFKEEQKKPEYI